MKNFKRIDNFYDYLNLIWIQIRCSNFDIDIIFSSIASELNW